MTPGESNATNTLLAIALLVELANNAKVVDSLHVGARIFFYSFIIYFFIFFIKTPAGANVVCPVYSVLLGR